MTADSQFVGSGFELQAVADAPADWDTLVQAVPAADYSHTSHWHVSNCASGAGAGQLWLIVRRDGQLIAGLGAVLTPAFRRIARVLSMHRLDSSVEGTSGGPLLHPDLSAADADRVFIGLVAAFLSHRPSGLATATIALNPLNEKRFGHLLPLTGGWERQDSPTAMVSLAGGIETVAEQRLVMNKRNERNRGLRRGAEVFATTDADLLAAYYPIYKQASAHWGITPTPLALLSELLNDPADRVFFTCVRFEDQVIGGHVCLHLGDRVFAWNGVTDPAFARTHFPATLCFWGDLVEACRRGAQWLDFGASGGVNSLAGFKRYFGAEVMERGFYVNDSSSMKTLRGVGEIVGRLRSQTRRRWHDGATGKSRSGGSA